MQLAIDPTEVLRFQLRRLTTNLFKEHLSRLESLAEEHDEALEKLHNALPPEYKVYVNLADYFTEDKAERLRKEVLGKGNDTIRAIEEQLANYSVEFKK